MKTQDTPEKLPNISPSNKATIKRPLRNAWQQKHLALDVTYPEIQRIADAAEKFASAWFHGGKTIGGPAGLVLAGVSGAGKSHVAKKLYQWCRNAGFTAFVQGFWPKPPSVVFVDWPSVADGFKAGQFGILEDFYTADLLFLDDIGAEHDRSQIATDKLCQVLSKREGKFSVVTTNIKPELWGEKFDKRIEDRLLRRTKVISLFGIKSYQLAK
jgi:DNA replication protein DnaC